MIEGAVAAPVWALIMLGICRRRVSIVAELAPWPMAEDTLSIHCPMSESILDLKFSAPEGSTRVKVLPLFGPSMMVITPPAAPGRFAQKSQGRTPVSGFTDASISEARSGVFGAAPAG